MHPTNRIAVTLIGFALSFGSGASPANVVAVVSAKSAVVSLSKNQIADIFLGRTNRFPDGAQATPIDQPETSSIREAFYGAVAGKSLAQLKTHWAKIIFTGRGQPPQIVSNGAEVKKLLAENPLAIGYIDSAQVDATVRVLRTP